MSKKIRKVGEIVLVYGWRLICDIFELLVGTFKVALTPDKKVPARSRALCSAVAAVITIVTLSVAMNSFISSGILYGFASFQKHLGIFWAMEGDWSHWMSGGRYTTFKLIKEELIATDSFAQFLSSLAGKGFSLKLVQLVLIALCYVTVLYLGYIALKCLVICVLSTQIAISQKATKTTSPRHHAKVIFADRHIKHSAKNNKRRHIS